MSLAKPLDRENPRSRPLASLDSLLSRHEFLIPLFFFVAFLAITLPGISWGAPAMWHPDEVVLRALKALEGNWGYYEANYNHPFLPQNLMYLLGRLVLALGGTTTGALVAARVLSAVLLGLVVLLSYYIARGLGANRYAAGLSSLLLLVTSEVMHNGHFAHTDAYVTFFATLALFCLVKYMSGDQRGWLYVSFLCCGLALSSKYNSLLLLLAPILVYLFHHRAGFRKARLAFFEPLFIGIVLWVLGFGIGTPKFLTWTSWFMKRAVPAFFYNGSYGYQPGSLRGLVGQYALLVQGAGWPLFLLFAAGVLWSLYRLIRAWRMKTGQPDPRAVLLLCILLLDLPVMISYNLAVRFLLPLLPMLAILAAFFIGDLYELFQHSGQLLPSRLLSAGLALVVIFSMARTLSVMLLFLNDSRYAAGRFLERLPSGTSLEETFYPPQIPEGKFEPEHNYPLYFLKMAGDTLPPGGRYELNAGEAGLVERGTDYLLVDSFTADRFKDAYTCQSMPQECDFFSQLASGESEHYRLLADFHYAAPAFLPQVQVTFVNPQIRIYERIK